MVKSFFNILNREISGLHQAAYLLGFFAICSQVLALFRDRILASQFGAGDTLDLYYSAFRIPDLLFVTIASLVSISVLIPFLIEHFEKGEKEAKEFIDSVFSFFFGFMAVAGIIAFFATPYLMALLFPVFKNSKSFLELVTLTRILLLSPVFLGFSNLLASITQVHRRFFIYAMSPVVYNVGIILGIVFLYPVFGISGLGFGVVIGAFFHFAIQVPFIASKKMLPKLRFKITFEFIKKIIYTSIPRTITVSSNEIAKLFLISFASFFVTGSISIFNFSLNLQSVPFSII
jgi:putative peptidoglycan lipid II flippase